MGKYRMLIWLIGFFLFVMTTKAQNCNQYGYSLTGEFKTNPASLFTVLPDANNQSFLYAAASEAGLIIFNISDDTKPLPIDTILPSALQNLNVMNLTQSGNYLFLALGNFFAQGTQPAGMAIVDVTDPFKPKVTDTWVSDSIVKGSAIVLVKGDYAYLGAMSEGVYIFDISGKSNIKKTSHILPDRDWPTPNPSSAQVPNARGMDIRNDTLFVCNDAGGLRVIDVTDKSNPKELYKYIHPDMKKIAHAYNNIAISGDLAFVAVDYCGMEVLDISDPLNPKTVSWWDPWDCQQSPLRWFNSPGHTNQVIYRKREKLAFLSSGDMELNVVDVSDPATPDSCFALGVYKDKKGAWGVSVTDDHVYVAYINTLGIPFASNWGGLKVLKWNGKTIGSLNFQKPNSTLKIYPNPSHGNFYISLPDKIIIEKVDVIDMKGALIKSYTEISPSHKIKIGQQGIFKVLVYTNDGVQMERVVVY